MRSLLGAGTSGRSLHTPRSRSCEWSRGAVLIARAVAVHSGFAARLCARYAIEGSLPGQPRRPSGPGCGVDVGFGTGDLLHRSPDSNAAICEVLVGICRTSHTRGRRCRSRGTRTHRIRVTISRSIDTFQLKRCLWITHKRRRTSTRPQPRGRQPASLLRSIRMCRARSG